jgi:hypothetical protein
MKKIGIIKKVVEGNTWKTQDGQDRQTLFVTIAIPYVRDGGQEGEDTLIAEHICGNPDYVKQLNELQQKKVELDLTLGFSVREWEGKEFNKIKLFNISQKIG